MKGDAEAVKGAHEAGGIFGAGFDPKINVLGVAGLGVLDDSVAAYDEVADFTVV